MSKILPILHEKSSTGKIKHWIIDVIGSPSASLAKIVVCYGADNDKVRVSSKNITKGKNIGKSNGTTPYEQALLEAEATWKKKLDKGYVEDLKDLNKEILLPMLAHTFQKRGHDIIYPCYVQPKLDGVRCLAKKIDDKTIKYYSRAGKEFTTLKHLTPDLLELMEVDQVLDGEIYSHDYTFQQAISYLKKLRPESKTLEYHVFDLVDTELIFDERWSLLASMFSDSGQSLVKIIDIEIIDDKQDVPQMHTQFVAEGFEGLILRNTNGMYKLKGRSKDLQKYKEFQDEEFEIIGGQESTGVEAGCIIFTVKNKQGQQFAVRPRGSFELRKQWMKDIDKLVNKKLTVRFQEKTDAGIPRFPVGITVRDYEI